MKLAKIFGTYSVKPATNVTKIGDAIAPFVAKATSEDLQFIVVPLDTQYLGLAHYCEDVGLDSGDLTQLLNHFYAVGWEFVSIVPFNYSAGVANGIERAHHAVFKRVSGVKPTP